MNESIVTNLTAEDSFPTSLERFKRNRLSRSQFGLMVDFMSLNPEIVHGRSSKNCYCSKETVQKKWEELSALLNADWTGPTRNPEKWKKTWVDQKLNIKARAAKRDECLAITGSDAAYKLNDLEERVLKLIKLSGKTKDTNCLVMKEANCLVLKEANCPVTKEANCPVMKEANCPVMKEANCPVMEEANYNFEKNQSVQNISHQIITPSGYIILGVRAENVVPVSLEPTNQSSKMESTNVLIGVEPENLVLTGFQSSSDKPVRVEETVISGISASVNELNKSQNINDSQLSLETVASNSEMQIQQIEDAKEKAFSSLLVKLKPCEISENLRNSSDSEDSQKPNRPGKTKKNVVNSSVQNSSGGSLLKKRKLSHPSFLRKNDISVAKLLQKQNQLLEGIAGTLTRIEKSVKDRTSLEVQRKNNMLINISENIERLAESLGTVSKSLKTVADN